MPLSSKIRSQFRSQAHKLRPVVTLGQHGLTANVVKEIDRALNDHELIKIKVASQDREARQQAINEIIEQSQAELIQTIGQIAVVYRKNPEKE